MNGIKFLLDTNCVFFLLQGKLNSFQDNLALKEIAISVITKMEFLSNPNLGPKDTYLFDQFLDEITTLYITESDENLINETVAIRKKYKLKLPDAIIASTAIVNNVTLLSADAVFSKIHNLKFQFIKS